MVSNIAVLLISMSSIMIAIASFKWVGSSSFESGVLMLVIGGIAWAIGSVMGYLFSALRQLKTKSAFYIRWSVVGLFAIASCVWPWTSNESVEFALMAAMFFCSGVFVPSVVGLHWETPEAMHAAYSKSLIGSGAGALLSIVILECRGLGAVFSAAAAVALLAPALEPGLFFDSTRPSKRWISLSGVLLAIVAAVFAPASPTRTPVESSSIGGFVGAENVFQFRTDRKFDVYVLGAGAVEHLSALRPENLSTSVRSLTISEQGHADKMISIPGIEVKFSPGNGRRKLSAESRRFDLIQVVEPMDVTDRSESRFAARTESTLTVEAMRLYFDRLKDDGFLQILGRQAGASAQSTLSTLAEAWKKSARRDVDLHAIAVMSDGGKVLETVIMRMTPFSREERDKLSQQLQIGKDESADKRPDGRLTSMLVSDSFGAVLTDNQPFGGTAMTPSAFSTAVMWLSIVILIGLIVWVARQERRRGIASRWQTASVATYFGGLGISFAFFYVFFVLRAIRGWGMPTISLGLVLAALFGSMAAGAVTFTRYSRPRYGVRFQSLAYFVFAVIFAYLGAALFEPLTASGSEWVSAFIGISVLIPFGLLGGAFLPNALEDASDKLAPRVLSLLWAIYSAGTALGLFAATMVSLENGIDVVFLIGLFCFVWVAIFSGLVRPWNVRKTPAAGGADLT